MLTGWKSLVVATLAVSSSAPSQTPNVPEGHVAPVSAVFPFPLRLSQWNASHGDAAFELRNDGSRFTIVLLTTPQCRKSTACMDQFLITRELTRRHPKRVRFIVITEETSRAEPSVMAESVPVLSADTRNSDTSTKALNDLFRSVQASFWRRGTDLYPHQYFVSPSGRLVAVSSGVVQEPDMLKVLDGKKGPIAGQKSRGSVSFNDFMDSWIKGQRFASTSELPRVIENFPRTLLLELNRLGAASGASGREYAGRVVKSETGFSLTDVSLGTEETVSFKSSSRASVAEFHTHPVREEVDDIFSLMDLDNAASWAQISLLALPNGTVFAAIPTSIRDWTDEGRRLDWSGVSEWYNLCVAPAPRHAWGPWFPRLYAKSVGVALYKLDGDHFVRLQEPPGTIASERVSTLIARVRFRLSQALTEGREITAEVLSTPSKYEVPGRKLRPAKNNRVDGFEWLVSVNGRAAISWWLPKDACTSTPTVAVITGSVRTHDSVTQQHKTLLANPSHRILVTSTSTAIQIK